MKETWKSLLIASWMLATPLISEALTEEGWREFPGVRESIFPYGYEVVDADFQVVKTVEDFQIANVKAFQDAAEVRYYLSDWSFDRMQAGEIPNYIRAIVPDLPEPDILDHRATPAEQRMRRRIEDALDLVDFGTADVDELSEYNGKSHFYDIVFAHHPLTYQTYKVNGESYGLGYIFSTPFDLDKTCMTIEWASGSSQGITNAVNQTLLESPHSESFLDSLPEVFQSIVDVYLTDAGNRVANNPPKSLSMPDKAAFVEFVRTDSQEYPSAYVVNVYREGVLVAQEELFDAKAFDIFVELLLRNATKRGLLDPEDASEWLEGFFSEVYAKTFQRFEHLLNGVDTIYWTGGGHFHFVPLELILQNSESALNETPMLRVKDASSLANPSKGSRWMEKGVLLVGDLDFDRESDLGVTSPTDSGLRSAVARAYVNREVYFSALPGTQVEIDQLASLLLSSVSAVPATVLRREGGSESSILEKLPDFGIAHFATHGFYLDDPQLSQKEGTDPFIRSGLTLTGANSTFQRWQNNEVTVSDDDGVLLAAELRELPLTDLKLIVFSACSTAEGTTFDNGTVLSLQSAALETGVESAVTTLWVVSDDATPHLMQAFYSELLLGTEPALALWKTRKQFFEEIQASTNLWIAIQTTAPFLCVSQAVLP
ncbi:MAG: CHAT domain-containing protein [Verrucomicrobiota bacterium]